MRSQTTWILMILLVAGLVLGAVSAPARAQGYFGVAAGIYEPSEDGQDRTEFFGIRGGYRFQSNFGLEGSLTLVDLADTIPSEDDEFFSDIDLQFDLYNLDLSLQWFPRGGNLVIFGGPGVARIDSEVTVDFFGERFSASDTTDIFTAHAGLAYEWDINDRFFIRPEARVRRYFDDEIDESDLEEDEIGVTYDTTDYEAGVTFGWRFGS